MPAPMMRGSVVSLPATSSPKPISVTTRAARTGTVTPLVQALAISRPAANSRMIGSV